MTLLELPAEVRKLNRMRQIAATLIRYELLSVKDTIVRPRTIGRRLVGRAAELPASENGARLIREVVQELGTTYIKFGQWLSVRPDFVPPEVIRQLELLQDRLTPVPFDIIRRNVERELRRPIESVFTQFDRYPLSTASIAQVHRAVLKSGEEVAVKVQHEGLRRIVATDLSVIRSIAARASKRFPELALHRPDDLLASFKATLDDEMDFTVEGKNQERIARSFDETRWMRIPKVYWDYTTERLLVMEYLDGFKLSQEHYFEDWGIDRKLVARRLSHAMFHMIFELGVFHSDPHPGNILFMRDNAIGLVDFGIVAKHDDDMRNKSMDWFYSVIYRDVDMFEQTFLDVGRRLAPIDRMQFRADCLDYIDEMNFQPAGRISFARVLASTNRILYRNKISAPPTFLFFFKAISTLEGVIRRIDSDFDWRADWGPRLKKLSEARYSPEAIVRRYSKVARDYDRLIGRYPEDVRDVLKRWKDGKYEAEIRVPNLEKQVAEIQSSLSKLSVALVLSSIILGLFIVGRGQGADFARRAAATVMQMWWLPVLFLLAVFYFRKR